jgi:hypothetical protein
MKKSQLKEAVKAVVRECLNERLAKEGCGSGKKRFTGKAGRMFKHVEDSEKEQGKSTKVAKKIAGATVNKNLKNEQVGADVVADEGMGNEASQTPMDDIIKHVIKKVPAIAGNPQKVARVSSLLFQHQFGGQQPPDQETLLGLVQKHMSAGHAPEGQEECGMEEAGMTSENGAEGYDEKEEIMLIKVMALIAKKLEAMHAGQPGSEVEPSVAAVGGEEEPSEEPSAPPFGGGEEKPEEPEEPSEPEHEEEPEEKPEPEEPSEPEDDEKEEKPVKEAAYKQVAPRAATDAKEDKARRIQTVPKVNETAVKMKMGPQYKTVAPRQARVTADDQARTIQFDPKMTEAQKKVKENHRVQTRSHVTVKDNPNDPNVMRDPENPQSNGA